MIRDKVLSNVDECSIYLVCSQYFRKIPGESTAIFHVKIIYLSVIHFEN